MERILNWLKALYLRLLNWLRDTRRTPSATDFTVRPASWQVTLCSTTRIFHPPPIKTAGGTFP